MTYVNFLNFRNPIEWKPFLLSTLLSKASLSQSLEYRSIAFTHSFLWSYFVIYYYPTSSISGLARFSWPEAGHAYGDLVLSFPDA